jgi:hypothetical protein
MHETSLFLSSTVPLHPATIRIDSHRSTHPVEQLRQYPIAEKEWTGTHFWDKSSGGLTVCANVNCTLSPISTAPHDPADGTHKSLDTLNVLPRRLIIQDVRDIVTEDLLASTTLVDTDHRDTDRPRCVPDRQAEVRVVCAQVLSHLHVVRDFRDCLQDVRREVLRVTGE